MFNRIKIIFKDKGLRNKILFVLAVLVLFRIGSSIPIPGVDHARLSAFFVQQPILRLAGYIFRRGFV